MNEAPSLSVIVPVFNGQTHIAEAIGSVRAQGHPSIEIIVVDDGSTDRTHEVVGSLAGPDLRCVRQENAGPAAARNRGIALARGEIIGFVDADDLWPASKLSDQLPFLAHGSGIEMVIGLTQCFRQKLDRPRERESVEPFFCFVMGCGLYRKSLFERVGPLDESMRLGEDTDWFNRARELGVAIRVLEAAGILYRRHEGNTTREITRARRGFLEAIHRSLARRRRCDPAQPNSPRRLHIPGARRPGPPA